MIRLRNIGRVAMILVIFASCNKGGDTASKGCTNFRSFNYDPGAKDDDGKCQLMNGCLGYIPFQAYSGTTSNTFRDTSIDNAFFTEAGNQKTFFAVPSTLVRVLNEPSMDTRNVYARESDGSVLYGYNMYMNVTQKYGKDPFIGVLAHVMAHRMQQKQVWLELSRTDHSELEADAFAAYYMAYIKKWSLETVKKYYNDIYLQGNYNFNDPVFHGTNAQRIKAVELGVNSGLSASQAGLTISLDSLHKLFSNKIRTQIDP